MKSIYSKEEKITNRDVKEERYFSLHETDFFRKEKNVRYLFYISERVQFMQNNAKTLSIN